MDLYNKIISEINFETLVDWYNLKQTISQSLQNKLGKYDDSAWKQISQLTLPRDFIQEFKEKLDCGWI